jgi:alpha-L-rhamnosidase
MYWVLDAYFRNGYTADALALTKTYYGWMLSQGATTWWEHFRALDDYANSLSHAWSGSPTWLLTTYVLGARQTGPQTWQVQPAFDGVDFASGAIPIYDGLLEVSWRGVGCEPRTVDIQAPAGTSGDVVLPAAPGTEIFWNGQPVWLDAPQDGVTVADGHLHLTVTEGNHHFEIRGNCAAP